MEDININLIPSFTETFVVTEQDLAVHVGSGDVEVLATPIMIAHMEHTASTLLAQFIQKGQTSVGAKINVTHDAPTPCGKEIKIVADMVGILGRTISFKITATDEHGTIGTAEHDRVIVDKAKFEAKAKAK